MLLTFKVLIFLTSFLFSPLSIARENKVIYGDDDRKDFFEIDTFQAIDLSRSTAAMISRRKLKLNIENNSYSIPKVKTLEQRMNVCPSVKYAEQPSLSICSGFLVAPDIIVTAGHCVREERVPRACEGYQWVFDYRMDSEQSINLDEIDGKNVYSCSKIIKHAYNPRTGEDFAIIKLDRKVIGRRPLKLNRKDKVLVGANLFIIGHPWGLPTKMAANAKVKSYSQDRPFNFEANLDSFQGNSGSAVFNRKTGLVEGILVAGKKDTYPSRKNDPESCLLLNRCSNEGGKTCHKKEKTNFELVTTISTILPYL